MMDIRLYKEMLEIDSTSGRERGLADFLSERLLTQKNSLMRFDVESMAGDVPEGCALPQNLLFSWGTPKVIFCTHLDTVPPYIQPRFEDSTAYGRGTCDAKGQIFAMWEVCKALEAKGYDGFGLLLLAGEETGSFGAKAFNSAMSSPSSVISNSSSVISSPSSVISSEVEISPDPWVIVGEPTDNCMATAEKGTKSYDVTFTGKSCHSGYPELGASAVMYFNDFVNALRSIVFPVDEVLGETTWNIGDLVSANPQNILSDRLTCRIYFRTTFESDEMVLNIMKNMAGPDARLRFGRPTVQDGSDIVAKAVAPWQEAMSVNLRGGDAPTRFDVLDGFPVKPVAFGSDAPVLKCFPHKILCGPGSIHVAHRPDEHIQLTDIEKAVSNYIRIFENIKQL